MGVSKQLTFQAPAYLYYVVQWVVAILDCGRVLLAYPKHLVYMSLNGNFSGITMIQ